MTDDFLRLAIEAERHLLACGWRDPLALHEEALEHELKGSSFILDEHSRQFAYLCGSLERDITPTLDHYIDVVVGIGEAHCDLEALDELDAVLWVDYRPQLVGQYAATVADNAEALATARQHLKAASALIGDNEIPLSKDATATLTGKHVLVISERDRLSLDEASALARRMAARSRRLIVAPEPDWKPEPGELKAMDDSARQI